MYTSKLYRLLTGVAIFAGAIVIMADTNAQGRLPPPSSSIIGPIVVAPAVPTYSALGNCTQFVTFGANETKLIACLFQPPIGTDTSDVVLATVTTGSADVQGWITDANPAPAGALSSVIAVDVELRNLTAFPTHAPMTVSAVIFYVPKSTTPAAATASVD